MDEITTGLSVESPQRFTSPIEQTAVALTGIKLLISVFPGVLYISCVFALIFYTIDEATCETMKRDLEARRGEEVEQGALLSRHGQGLAAARLPQHRKRSHPFSRQDKEKHPYLNRCECHCR